MRYIIVSSNYMNVLVQLHQTMHIIQSLSGEYYGIRKRYYPIIMREREREKERETTNHHSQNKQGPTISNYI